MANPAIPQGNRTNRNGFRVKGLGFRVKGLGFRVKGLGFRVKGLGFRVKGWKLYRVRGPLFDLISSFALMPDCTSDARILGDSSFARMPMPWLLCDCLF